MTDPERGEAEYIRAEEIIALYRLLERNQEQLSPRLVPLLDRVERRLYNYLSIEEIESLPDLNEAAVEELSKKL